VKVSDWASMAWWTEQGQTDASWGRQGEGWCHLTELPVDLAVVVVGWVSLIGVIFFLLFWGKGCVWKE